MLHSKVLSWLPLSPVFVLLEPGLVLSVAAVEPLETGGGAAVAIYRSIRKQEGTGGGELRRHPGPQNTHMGEAQRSSWCLHQYEQTGRRVEVNNPSREEVNQTNTIG